MVHACNPSTLGGRGRWILEFEAGLVYRVSSRTARAIQRNPVYKQTNKRSEEDVVSLGIGVTDSPELRSNKSIILLKKSIKLLTQWILEISMHIYTLESHRKLQNRSSP